MKRENDLLGAAAGGFPKCQDRVYDVDRLLSNNGQNYPRHTQFPPSWIVNLGCSPVGHVVLLDHQRLEFMEQYARVRRPVQWSDNL